MTEPETEPAVVLYSGQAGYPDVVLAFVGGKVVFAQAVSSVEEYEFVKKEAIAKLAENRSTSRKSN